MTDETCGYRCHKDEACCHDMHCDTCGRHPHEHDPCPICGEAEHYFYDTRAHLDELLDDTYG